MIITKNEISTACRASCFCLLTFSFLVRPINIGTVPRGSIITKKVTTTDVNSAINAVASMIVFPVLSLKIGVSNGTRTRDVLDHNQVLYQLSYTHQVLLLYCNFYSILIAILNFYSCSTTNLLANSLAISEPGPGWATMIASR